VKAPS